MGTVWLGAAAASFCPEEGAWGEPVLPRKKTEPADPKARRFSGGNLGRPESGSKRDRDLKFANSEKNVSLHVAPARERAAERDLVRVLEVAADRETAGQSGHSRLSRA